MNAKIQKLPSTIRFLAPSSGKVTLEIEHKNGYADMQADYHIDSEDCINITIGWKDFVSQNGFEPGEVAMVFFYKEEDSLKFIAQDFMCAFIIEK